MSMVLGERLKRPYRRASQGGRFEGSGRSFPNLYGLEMELEISWGQGSDEIPGVSWSRRGFGILGKWLTTGISGLLILAGFGSAELCETRDA